MTKYTCITLWQPWASLCCITHPKHPECSVKQFETRDWATKKRGVLLIHAAKRFGNAERRECQKRFKRDALIQHYRTFGDIPLGSIIGAVWLEDCHRTEDVSPFADDYAKHMGNYEPGRFAWEITHPILFTEPIPYRGQQGLYNVPADVLPAEFEAWRAKLEVQHA